MLDLNFKLLKKISKITRILTLDDWTNFEVTQASKIRNKLTDKILQDKVIYIGENHL